MKKKTEQIKPDKKLFDGIMFAYSMLQKLVFQRLKGSGLTAGQPKILEFLAESGSVIQKEIARACEIETSTAGRLLRKMEDSGLVQRKQLPENRRAAQVSLTDFGKKQACTVQETFRICEEAAFSGIGESQRHHFVRTLCQMEDNLRAAGATATEIAIPERKQDGLNRSSQSLHRSLQACQALLYQQLFRFLKDTELTPGQPKILEFLETGEGSQQKEIAAACRIEPATVTSLLLYMEQAGLIRRREENGNRRSQYVYLTEKGRQNMRRTVRALEQTVESAFFGMEQEQSTFGKTLQSIHGNLRQAIEKEA